MGVESAVLQYIAHQPAILLPPTLRTIASANTLSASCSVLIHSQVLKQGSELITSRQHHRSRSRVSFFVLLQLTSSHQRVAEVLYYTRVQPRTAPVQASSAICTLRLAVCNVFASKPRLATLHVVGPNAVQHAAKAFSIDNVVTVLASAHLGRNNGQLCNCYILKHPPPRLKGRIALRG